jgi:hypothetical protein
MANCRYCGKPAGIFRASHSECDALREKGLTEIPRRFDAYLNSSDTASKFKAAVTDTARSHFISDAELKDMAMAGCEGLLIAALQDHVLTHEEEQRIRGLATELAITQEVAPKLDDKIFKAALLRDLVALHGTGTLSSVAQGVTEQVRHLGLNLKRGEYVVWFFGGVTFLQFRTKTHYVGRSHGVSLRVMKGVYYRVGASRGEPVTSENLTQVDIGMLVVTQRTAYFKGPMRTVSIPTAKILSVDAYSDGISITRDAVNAKPQFFKLDDPWFAANLILKVAALSDAPSS